MEKFQQLVSHRIDCSTAIQHDERSVIAYLQRAGNFSNKWVNAELKNEAGMSEKQMKGREENIASKDVR